MRSVAVLPAKDRYELFRNTSARMGLNEAIIEKDFWVCFILDYLFHMSRWNKSITFKGGTSLSKAFHQINRFSEDVDLILDWRVLGYEINEPWAKRSKTKQDLFNKEANARAEAFLADEFCPALREELIAELKQDVNIYIDQKDKQTVIFEYPVLQSSQITKQMIRLEIGALAAWTPAEIALIRPYSAECYPTIFKQEATKILTVSPIRTFWEKVAILHQEANRPENLPTPSRYSRHYYDIYCMLRTNIGETALSQIELLRKVVEFKIKFYPRAWAKYEDAKPGTLLLVPPAYRFSELISDYRRMRDMIYGQTPDFSEIIGSIREFENKVNLSVFP